MKVSTIILSVALIGVSVAYFNKPTTSVAVKQSEATSAEQVVYDVCNSSRIQDFPSEQTCGELLDYYSLDFICKANDKNVMTHCQVERI